MESSVKFGYSCKPQTLPNLKTVKAAPSRSSEFKIPNKAYTRRKRSRHSDESLSSSENLSKYQWLQEEKTSHHEDDQQLQEVSQEWQLTDHKRVGLRSTEDKSSYPCSNGEFFGSRRRHCEILGKPVFENGVASSSDSYDNECNNNKPKQKSHSSKRKREHTAVEQSFKCDECDQDFSQKLHLILHKRVHIQANPTNCNACGTSLVNSSRQVAVHKCDECEKEFTQQLQLILHKRGHRRLKNGVGDGHGTSHTPKEQTSLNCPKAQRTKKLFQCEECEKSFNQELRLVLHRRVHDGERLYKCQECGMPFSQQSSLNYHKLTHGVKILHKSEVCSSSFRIYSTLTEHKPIHAVRKRLTF